MSNSPPARIIVMTGATAGIGAEALKHFVALPDTLILIGARGSGRQVPEGAEMLPLDLTSLASVREFAHAVKQRLGNAKIDMLVLNAGTQAMNTEQLSPDGFELTFAVNHLAHFLLARLLQENLADDGRLVITTSDTHDPAIFPMAPKVLDPEALAHPKATGFGSGMRAYSASKLCNLLTARAFAEQRALKDHHISTIAFNPGATLDTDLSRSAPPLVRAISRSLMGGLFGRLLFGLLSKFNPAFYPGTCKRAGEALAQITLGTVKPPAGRTYVSLVKGEITYPDPSPLAQSVEARELLWRESEKMVVSSLV